MQNFQGNQHLSCIELDPLTPLLEMSLLPPVFAETLDKLSLHHVMEVMARLVVKDEVH